MTDSTPLGNNTSNPFATNGAENDSQIARLARFHNILAKDDIGRANSQVVTMICTSGFTVVQTDTLSATIEQVIRIGDEFQIYAYDLPRYAGRGRQKSTP